MPPAANFSASSSSSSSSTSSSSRWCPTPGQLMMLEEMYRAGVRTPNSSQIQHFTSQLSHYGKIEGKNVFYWFQNHKARDRQKLRRKLCKQLQLQQQQLYHNYHHQQQVMLNQKSRLGYLDAPPAYASLHQPPPPPPLCCKNHLHNSFPGFLPQVAVERSEIEKPVKNTYGHDWMMTSTTPTPLKTLQLFPIRAEDHE